GGKGVVAGIQYPIFIDPVEDGCCVCDCEYVTQLRVKVRRNTYGCREPVRPGLASGIAASTFQASVPVQESEGWYHARQRLSPSSPLCLRCQEQGRPGIEQGHRVGRPGLTHRDRSIDAKIRILTLETKPANQAGDDA